jgi:hypothetical protein
MTHGEIDQKTELKPPPTANHNPGDRENSACRTVRSSHLMRINIRSDAG